MNIFHITVSVANLTCGIAALLGWKLGIPALLNLGVFFGYWANLLAAVTAFFIVVLLIVRAFSGKTRQLLASSWLGLLNGFVVLMFWGYIVLGEAGAGARANLSLVPTPGPTHYVS